MTPWDWLAPSTTSRTRVSYTGYWLRDQHRVLYGTTEIVVGLPILLVVFDIIPTPIILTADSGESPWHTVPNIIGFFTGVYALVRGWDNIITELRS
jgi:hypothetical protein